MITDTIANPVISIFSGLFDNIKNIASSITDASSTGLDSYTDQTIETQESTDLLTDSIGSVTDALSEEASEIMDNMVSQEELADATRNGADEVDNLGNSSRGAAIATRLLKTAISTLTTVLVSMAISAVVEYLYDLAHAEERIAEKAEEAKNNIDKLNSEFENQKKVVNEAIKSYDDLAKGVDSVTNKNISLSTEDYEKYLDLNNQLVDIFPELYNGLDKNGNAILNLGKNGKTAAEELSKTLEEMEKLKNFKISQEVPDLFAGIKQKIDEAKESSEEFDKISEEMKASLEEIRNISKEGILLDENNQYSLSGNINNPGEELKINAIKEAVELYKESIPEDSELRKELEKSGFDFYVNDTIMGDYVASLIGAEVLDDEQFNTLNNMIKDKLSEVAYEFSDETNKVFTEALQNKQEIESAWKDFLPSLVSTMESSVSFNELDDDMQNIARHMVSNLSLDVADQIDTEDPYAWEDWIRKNVTLLLTNLSEDNKKILADAYNNLFNFKFDPSEMSINEATSFIDKQFEIISKILNKDKEQLKIEFGFNDIFELDSNIDNEIIKVVTHFRSILSKELNSLEQEGGINLDIRPIINTSLLEQAGWGEQESGETSAFFKTYTSEDGLKSVVLTPILPDGTVLSPEALQTYANKILSGEVIDTPVKVRLFEGTNSAQNAQNYANKISDIRNEYDEMQEATESFFKEQEVSTQDQISLMDELLKKAKDFASFASSFSSKNALSSDDLSFGATITQLDTMTSKFDQLDESYSKLVDGDKDTNIDFTDYTAIQEAFEGVDGIEEYIERLQEVNGNAEETQKVFDDMATALVDQMDIADILNEKNAGLIAEYLELKGVVNGSEIVYAQLEAQQMANTLAIDNQKIATLDGVKAIYSQIDGLLNQTEATGITTTATYQLIAAQTVFDNTSLNTGQKIQALEELAKSFGITADAADLSAEKAKMMGDITTAMMDGADAAEIEKIMSSYLSTAGSKYEDAIAAKFGNLSASYGGGANSRKAASDAAKQKEETKEEIDWIERYLDKLQERRDQLSQKADSSFLDYLGISQEDLERARELLSSAITPDSDALNELSEIAQRAGMSIKELQDMIFSGAEASGRQSYLTQVLEADRIRLNANTIAVEKYRAEYLKLAEKLPEDIRNKIESNVSLEELGIEEYSSEQAEEINKAMDAYDLLKDKEAERNEIKEDGINSIIAYYQNELDYIDAQNEAIENSNSLIESQMNYLKESGQIISAGMYEQLISNSDRLIDLANDRIKTSKEELEDLLSDPDFNIEEDSETYYEIKNTIAETENEIWGLREAQEAYNNELLQMPINNMDIILNMYQSMTSEIENWGSVWEASGKTLDQTYYQTLIKNGMEIIDQYKEQADLVIDIMDEYEKGSDQWNDLYDKLSNINSEITSIVENMYAWNEALLQLPLDNLDKYLNNLQQVSDAITNVISEYDTVITAVTTLIQNEIDAVNEEKDAVNESYQDRIDALQDQLDLLEKQNEEKNLQLALEQAQYELEQLRNQKTNRVRNCPLL